MKKLILLLLGTALISQTVYIPNSWDVIKFSWNNNNPLENDWEAMFVTTDPYFEWTCGKDSSKTISTDAINDGCEVYVYCRNDAGNSGKSNTLTIIYSDQEPPPVTEHDLPYYRTAAQIDLNRNEYYIEWCQYKLGRVYVFRDPTRYGQLRFRLLVPDGVVSIKSEGWFAGGMIKLGDRGPFPIENTMTFDVDYGEIDIRLYPTQGAIIFDSIAINQSGGWIPLPPSNLTIDE